MTTQNLAKAIRITALVGVYYTAILMCYRQWFTDFLLGSIWILSPHWFLFLTSKTKQIQENKPALWATFLMAILVVAGSLPLVIEETLFSNSPKDGIIFFALPCLQLPCLIIGVFIGMVFMLIKKLRTRALRQRLHRA